MKHREGWVLDDLVTGTRRDHDKSIVQWWIQCVTSCPQITGKHGYVKFRKEPLLAFRRNRQPWLVMARVELWEAVEIDVVPPATFKLANVDVEPDNVVVMRLEDFLTLVPVPDGLRNHRGAA